MTKPLLSLWFWIW